MEGLLEREEERSVRGFYCDVTAEARKLGYLAGPMVGVTLSLYLVQVTSSMMVGHLGELALSSSAIATSLSGVTGFSLMDVDQLLEKRVRSRFSHRKLLFTPLSTEDMQRLLEHLLYLTNNLSLPSKYVKEFNSNVNNILGDKKFKEILDVLSSVDNTISNICRFLYHAISWMHFESGLLTLDGFKNALSCM